MGLGNQLLLLLWKNFTLRKRQPVRVVIELLWPLCLFLILVAVRTRPDIIEKHHECHFDGKAMPSAGTLPFLQTYLCTYNNTCHTTVTPDEIAGSVDSFNTSLIAKLIEDVEAVLANNTEREEIFDLLDDLRNLQNVQDLIRNGSSVGTITLGNILVDPEKLRQQINDQNIDLTDDALNALLNASLSVRNIFGNVTRDKLVDSILTLLESVELPSSPADLNITLDRLREDICNESYLGVWLEFSNPAEVKNVQTQLCNLNYTQVVELYRDFREQISLEQVLKELSEYTYQNTGTRPNFNIKSYERILRIFTDVGDLESLTALQKDLASIRDEMSEANQDRGSVNVTRELSRLVCGRESSFLQIDSSNNNNLFQGQNDDGRVNLKESEKNQRLEEKEREEEEKEFSPFCLDLFASLEKTRYTRIIWRQIKPIILGVIPYTPDNAATRSIIKQANATFENLADLLALADDWLNDLSPRLNVYLYNSSNINILREITSREGCKQLERIQRLAQASQQFANITIPSFNSSMCDFLSGYLYNGPNTTGYDWRDSLNSTNMLVAQMRNYLQCFKFDKFRPFPTENALVEKSMELIETNTFWAGLVFKMDGNTTTLPEHISYKIRMDTEKIDSTKRVQDKYWKPGPRMRAGVDTKYLTYGFAFLQDMVDHAIIRSQTGVEEEVGVFLQQFPYPCYVRNKFTMAISRSMPLFMVLAWIYSVAMIIKGIVYEKERRLKEVMKMMGLGNGVHWLAWFINAFVMMIVTVVLLVAILKGGKVMEHSDPSVIFVFMLSFTVCTIMQCFLISVFFSKANLAAVCGGFIYFVLYIPYTQVIQWEEYLTTTTKMLSCLSSNVAFGFGCSYISRYEEQMVGLQWSNIASSPIPEDDFNMARCIFMMFLDAFIYGVFMWYIEAVFPGQYGIPRKWYFPIQRSYWCGQRYQGDSNSLNTSANMEMNCDKENLEPEPSNSNVGVSINNLTKVYKNGKKLAVDGLSVNFYEGQITSFLGHNGAGKTTTMSILTGLFPPTSGTAYINGKDIRSHMDEIRSSLGMCPQHNVLFDNLTVEEHIWFYARLKGRTNQEVKVELPQMIKDVGLPNKVKDKSCNLSGGMKRKLSVAIAFVGGSRTVILDEPTAGVDPYARRAIWDLLVKLRTNRTIILSTHHMDEADILGDRIAIISSGRLCCCGTSLFLKNRFGSGYYLTLVRQEDDDDQDKTQGKPNKSLEGPEINLKRPSTAGSVRSTVDVMPIFETDDEGYSEKQDSSDKTSSNNSSGPPTPPPEGATMIPGFSEKRVTAFIQKYVSGATLTEDNNTELCYQLPGEAAQSGAYEHLFSQLERCHFDLGISSFGISDTSLEEVFLKVAEETGVDEPTDEMTRSSLEKSYDGGKYPRPVTRLSFRGKRKFGIFPVKTLNRVNSNTDLMEDSDLELDTESVTSEPAIDPGFCAEGEEKLSGLTLIRRQFQALFLKRFHHVRRSKKGFVCEVILPAGFVCLAMVFALILPPFKEEPELELHPWLYVPKKGDPHLYMFYSNDAPGTTVADDLEHTLLTKPYPGTRCMNSSVYQISGYPCDSPTNVGKWTARPKLTGNLSLDSPDCSCETGIPDCPPGAGGPTPSSLYLPTSDYLYNMTGRNISDWLVKTMDKYIKKRYGGLSFGDKNPVARLNATQLIDIADRLLRASNNGTTVISGNETVWDDIDDFLKNFVRQEVAKVWFNNKGWAASVSYMNVLNNLILRSYLPASKNPNNFGITTINHPMNYTREQLNDEAIMNSFIDVFVAICVIFAMSFIPASFVLVLIEERVSNSKHLQFVSGVNPTIYWVANIAWDMMNYLIPAVLCIFIFLAFNKEAYVSSKNAPCLVSLLFMYGWAIIPMMYPFARLFSVPSSAFVALSCVNVFLGTVSTLSTFIVELLATEDPELADINNILKQVFLLLPHYCLGRGLIDMTAYQLQSDIFSRFDEELDYNIFEWKIVGRNLFAMFMLGIFFFFFNLLLEYRFFFKPRKVPPPSMPLDNEDIDVARERRRVTSGGANNDTLRLENLSKVYSSPGRNKNFTAVDRLCVGIPKGQCFGLLGVNGAGKTTTFKMLTGDVSVTSGSAFVQESSILKEMVKVRQLLGYCPQFDALDSLLTGREHLQFYARLRGVPEKDIKHVSEWAIRKLGLLKYADRIAGDYSGGNKRKLSTAIALIGNPPVIFLDEPTTGMDPKARRFLWTCINSIIKDGRSVILTSHSMEECEALCGRLAIMVNGRFKCIGSPQHLKNRFGNGYTITLRASGSHPDLEPVKTFISEQFPEAVLKESHHNMLQYQLGTSSISLSRLFGKMETCKTDYNIESYSVCQTTLDQVFINFAKLQTDMDIDVDELPEDLMLLAYATAVDPNVERIIIEDEQSVTGSTAGLILPDKTRDSFMADVSVA